MLLFHCLVETNINLYFELAVAVAMKSEFVCMQVLIISSGLTPGKAHRVSVGPKESQLNNNNVNKFSSILFTTPSGGLYIYYC